MPNGISRHPAVDITCNTSANRGHAESTPPVAGRWGEAQSVPGYPIPHRQHCARGRTFNLVGRRQLSTTASAPATRRTSPTWSTASPRDAADDNYNSFDPYPPVSATYNRLGEVERPRLPRPRGGFLLPVERMRRYLTPADINGTGHVLQWNNTQYATGSLSSYDLGGDQWGAWSIYSYFRPPGLPGQVALPGGTGIPARSSTRGRAERTYPST